MKSYERIVVFFYDQIEWFKKFFSKAQDSNDMRKLIEFLITCVFLFTFVKEALMFGTDDDIPDMPSNWLLLFCAILGIKGLQEVTKNLSVKEKPNGTDPGKTLLP